jgi:hypothetical protein
MPAGPETHGWSLPNPYWQSLLPTPSSAAFSNVLVGHVTSNYPIFSKIFIYLQVQNYSTVTFVLFQM